MTDSLATSETRHVHPHNTAVPAKAPAVVLVNLGTPAEPTPAAVRTFLRKFLSDRRVIEMNPLLWRPILSIILAARPLSVAAKYKAIWLEQGSPLMHYSVQQAKRLQEELGQDATVRVAMRYSEPTLPKVLDELYAAGHRRVLVIPAYPQYTATCGATVMDEAARWLLTTRDHVELRTVRSFPTAPAYVEALAASLERHWREAGRPDFEAGERVIASFHAIPAAMHNAGDPYRSECEATSAALAERLGIPAGGLVTTYQSVFGRAEWIGPATIDTVEALGKEHCPRVDVICPGFVADCLETLEEIDQLNRETFEQVGGGAFHYVRWGNDSAGCVAAFAEQARSALSGWTPTAPAPLQRDDAAVAAAPDSAPVPAASNLAHMLS
ncbi:ferrochelatase [Buchananella felis]|uniref:ferrochelatase n=1 Tax=Buchananella felis TaxID=3231492 RepID=UPI003529557B